MNSENGKTFLKNVLPLKLTDKLDLRIGEKVIALSNLSIYYTQKNIKSSYNINKSKISAPTWSEEFKLPDGSYSVSDIQDYFKYIFKKHGEDINKPSAQIYANKIKNGITFNIKNGYTPKLLASETMKLLGSSQEITWRQFIRNFTSKSYLFKTFNSEYDEIKIWFTDQNSEPLEIEDRINLTLVIK